MPAPRPAHDADGDCYDDDSDDPIAGCTPQDLPLGEDGDVVDDDADCVDDVSGKPLDGCDAGAPVPDEGEVEEDDEYCLQSDYVGDAAGMADCCKFALLRNVLDNDCKALGFVPKG